MSLSGDFNEILSFSAREFVNRGWSVIPLKGDLSAQAAKAPAISTWREFQRRLPTERELDHWFVERGYPAMGIVLGAVSGLVVIDIDAPGQAEMFLLSCPDLADTFTVRSGNRGLPHYYYRIPQGMSVPSRYGGGVELRSNGQYVVAPGVGMAGRVWEVVNDAAPRILNEIDLRRILDFLDPETRATAAGAAKPRSEAKSPLLASASASAKIGPGITVAGLRRRYSRLAGDLGRNNALFSVAVFARDRGWTRERVESVLVDAHVVQPPAAFHPKESILQRRQEARRTIGSVFARPAQPVLHRELTRQLLPNAVRERLLQNGLGRVARVLDGLLMAGIGFGQAFTAAQAYAAVSRFGIGRNTVFAVLKTILDNGCAIFRDLRHPSPLNSPSHNADAATRCAVQTKPCLFGRVANPVKSAGRPAALFVMPAIERLCQWLDVRARSGDELRPEDLRSPAQYRAALHAALIRRAPGKYPRKWQAQRLGISQDSCRRYEKRTGVRVHPTYKTWAVTWGNMERIFPDEAEMGHFLEDEKGKRYPPLRVIARRLLAQGKRLLFRSQDANHYELRARETTPTPSDSAASMPANVVAPAAPWLAGARKQRSADQQPIVSVAEWVRKNPRTIQKPKRQSVANPAAPSSSAVLLDVQARTLVIDTQPAQVAGAEGAEASAERLYQTLRNLNAQRSISRNKARQLVDEYGCSQVERGLRVLLQRRNVRNPAGFMQVLLRSQQAFG